MFDLDSIIKMNDTAAVVADFRVGRDGVLSGPAAAAQAKYLGFSPKDAVAALRTCAKSVEDKLRAVPGALEESMARPFDKALVMAIPLPDDILEALDEFEDRMLADTAHECHDCPEFHQNFLGGGSCSGIMEKGDLLRGLLSAALIVGMERLVEVAMALDDGGPTFSPDDVVERMMPQWRDKPWERA